MKQANPAPNKSAKQKSYGAQRALRRAAFPTSRTFYFRYSFSLFSRSSPTAKPRAPILSNPRKL